MTPERWQEVERLFHAALEKAADERPAFLDHACAGDADLRHEVESLLAEEAPAGSFLGEPARQRAARAIAASEQKVRTHTLSAGARLGPYEIVKLTGAGGMGEVYQARDTRLDRTVAIKVLPPEVSHDPDRRARFEREARTVAGLNHPHICTLHDVGEHDGAMFLVMEHLTGDSLAERLRKGPLPLGQALQVAAEIADALAAAHRQGIIHRDLKPGNVMLTKAGAKLLDFGLAKLRGHGEEPAASRVASLPTQPAPLTGEGTIVGTLQYMAPEQLEARPPDARTDLWALGALIYEMVTGAQAFEGTSAASLIGAILEREPVPLAKRQPLAPPALDRLVRRCLAKAPDDRWDTAHDVSDELRWISQTGAPGAATVAPRTRRLRWTAMVLAGGLLLVLTGAGVTWLLRPSASPAAVARLSLDVRPAETINSGGAPSLFLPTPGGSRTAVTWTPDGRSLIFVGRRAGVQQLYVRHLEAAVARPVPGTEGAQAPAVSADGLWVAFWSDGAIRKVPVGGGPADEVTSGIPLPPMGLAWGASGSLVFGSRDDGRIWAIPPGGAPRAVTTLGETELGHVLPWLLPDEHVLLYTVRKRNLTWGDEELVAQTLATGQRKVLLRDAADARYVSSGYLVFMRRGVLYAVPFSPERLEVSGSPVAVLDGVAQALTGGHGANVTGAGQFAVSATGTLAWLPGGSVQLLEGLLVTVDRRGHVVPLAAPVRTYGPSVRVSPDGKRVALSVRAQTEESVWLYDLGRHTLTHLAGEGEASDLIWARDGKRLLIGWLWEGRWWFATQPVDGAAADRVLLPCRFTPTFTTPDGRQVIGVRDLADIVSVRVHNQRADVQPLIATPATEGWPELSPDGRWLAYVSDVSGRQEVYLQPYPGPGPTELVSLEGGSSPAWHPGGRELFFTSLPDRGGSLGLGLGDGTRRMMTVEFADGTSPRVGRPRPLFMIPTNVSMHCGPIRCYDVAPDGESFYAMQRPMPQPPPVVTHVNLILNWFEELKAKVPHGQ